MKTKHCRLKLQEENEFLRLMLSIFLCREWEFTPGEYLRLSKHTERLQALRVSFPSPKCFISRLWIAITHTQDKIPIYEKRDYLTSLLQFQMFFKEQLDLDTLFAICVSLASHFQDLDKILVAFEKHISDDQKKVLRSLMLQNATQEFERDYVEKFLPEIKS